MTEPVFADEPQILQIEGPVGCIELETAAGDQAITAIVLHADARHGGSNRGKVVRIVERALRELGADTILPNLRGAGASAGACDDGRGEVADLAAVVSWAIAQRPGNQLWLAGYGLGAYIAQKALPNFDCDLLVTIAPPVGRYDYETLALPEHAWLMVLGDNDTHAPTSAVLDYVESLDNPPELLLMADTDHDFHRRVMDLRGALKNGIRRLQ